MTAFRQYFEDNPEIFAALVAAIGILGGLLGSIIGAKIQANGGRDQAAAAREAAQIAAEAQRVAALWAARQLQIAQFIQSARDVVDVCNRYYEDGDDGSLTFHLHDAVKVMRLKSHEVELVAPKEFVEAAQQVLRAVDGYSSEATMHGETGHAHLLIRRLLTGEDEDVARAARAAEHAVLHGGNEGMDYAVRLQRIAAVPGISEKRAHLLLQDWESDPRWNARLNNGRKVFEEKLRGAIRAGRAALRSEDDFAPAVPEQRRRRWLRRAA
ncbi:hypothetical protein ACF1CG_34795 [Streptomyces sp. NPDC014773]|uniref:hypothetical protein n=1 Tax=Streptomyces sp. NPDC014773 TaxID=3364908 RepID=UPI0036F55103